MNVRYSTEQTPRDTRLRFNRMERWFRKHTDHYTAEDQVFLRLAFEYAEKPHDADVLAQALRDGYHERPNAPEKAGVLGPCSTKASTAESVKHL